MSGIVCGWSYEGSTKESVETLKLRVEAMNRMCV